MLDDYMELDAFVSKARKALESDSVKYAMENLKDFPYGGCGDASLLLGNALRKAGFEGYDIVYGSTEIPRYNSHAWLENSKYLIDITGGQFKEGGFFLILCKIARINEYMSFDSTGPGSLDLGYTWKAWNAFRKELEIQGIALLID